MALQVRCGTENRRQLVKNSPDLNGIDYLEVYTSKNSPESGFRTLIVVYFFKSGGLEEIRENNILFSGGVRIRKIKAEWVQIAKAILQDIDNHLDTKVTQDLLAQEADI